MPVWSVSNIYIQNLAKFIKITIKHKLHNKQIWKHHSVVTAIYKLKLFLESFYIFQQYREVTHNTGQTKWTHGGVSTAGNYINLFTKIFLGDQRCCGSDKKLSASKISVFSSNMRWLTAQEDFIVFISPESLKSYVWISTTINLPRHRNITQVHEYMNKQIRLYIFLPIPK